MNRHVINTHTLACCFTAAAVAALVGLSSCATPQSATTVRYDTVTTMSGLRYIDFVTGSGPVIQPGQTVRVNYAGYLLDGTLFDTSLDSVGRMYVAAE